MLQNSFGKSERVQVVILDFIQFELSGYEIWFFLQITSHVGLNHYNFGKVVAKLTFLKFADDSPTSEQFLNLEHSLGF